MRRRTLIVLAAAAAALLAALAAWMLFFGKAPQPAAPSTPSVQASEQGRSVVNLYLADPTDLSDVTENVELTLLKTIAVSDRSEETIFEGATKVVIKRGLGEKILSAPMRSDRLKALKLVFAPVASTTTRGGAVESLYVDQREIEIVFAEDIPLGRTLLAALRIPLSQAFTAKNGVPALRLPERAAAERATVGGMLIGEPGRLFPIQGASLEDLVRAEYGLDLSAINNPGSKAVTGPSGGAPTKP